MKLFNATKMCQRCRRLLSIDCFGQTKRSKAQGCSRCESCVEYENIWYKKHRDRRKLYLRNYYKNNKKDALAKFAIYRKENKELIKNRQKRHREKNKEKIKLEKAAYFQKNKEKVYAYVKKNYAKILEAQRQRKKTPKARVNASISTNMRNSIKNNKNGRPWEQLASYSLDDLVKHLNKLMKKYNKSHPNEKNMTWDNYGEWHIDHKIPISAFNFTKPEHIDFKKCWSLSNLQPLWARDNVRKYSTLTKPFQPSLRI